MSTLFFGKIRKNTFFWSFFDVFCVFPLFRMVKNHKCAKKCVFVYTVFTYQKVCVYSYFCHFWVRKNTFYFGFFRVWRFFSEWCWKNRKVAKKEGKMVENRWKRAKKSEKRVFFWKLFYGIGFLGCTCFTLKCILHKL